MWSKSRDSFLDSLVIITIIRPLHFFAIFNFPVQTNQYRVGLFLIGLAAVMQIKPCRSSEADKIGQVFEAKKVSVEGKFRLVKGDSNEAV